MCILTPPYELDHARPSFQRGYWSGFKDRAPNGMRSVCCRTEYDAGFAAGAADRRTVELMWTRYSGEGRR
jgi:hypothetical protein